MHRGWGEQDAEKRKKENVDFIENAVTALEQACPKFQFLTFPTGGKVKCLVFTESEECLNSDSGTDLNTVTKSRESARSRKMHLAFLHHTATTFSTMHKLILSWNLRRGRAGTLRILGQMQLY